jgi:ACT domain-containing protein
MQEAKMAASKTRKGVAEAAQICIVTVTGADRVGIIAKLATIMAGANINIVDVNQKIMEKYFVMTMAVDIAKATADMAKIRKLLDKAGGEMSLNITIQDENIFKAMHRI